MPPNIIYYQYYRGERSSSNIRSAAATGAKARRLYSCTVGEGIGILWTRSRSDWASSTAILPTCSVSVRIAVGGAVVVAHSFGGRVAISLAARHPETVKGLVLISSAGVRPRRSLRRFCKVAAFKLRRRLGLDVSRCGSADYRAAQGCLREVLKLAVRDHQEGQLRKICVPVLVIYGKDDRETPPYTAKKIARLVADGAAIGLSGGHFCYLEHASSIAAAIRALAKEGE